MTNFELAAIIWHPGQPVPQVPPEPSSEDSDVDEEERERCERTCRLAMNSLGAIGFIALDIGAFLIKSPISQATAVVITVAAACFFGNYTEPELD